MGCEYAELHGAAWVVASADTLEDAIAAVQLVGPRAAGDPGSPAEQRPGAWAAGDCESLELLVGTTLARDDFSPYAGDAMPYGLEWDVLTLNGVAQWCSVLGTGSPSVSEQVQIYVMPGSRDVQPDSEQDVTPIEVAGASAWLIDAPGVLASTGDNAILVTARFLTSDQLAAIAQQVIGLLDARR